MWRSLVARFVRDEEVAGSNPVIPTIFNKRRLVSRRRSFLGMGSFLSGTKWGQVQIANLLGCYGCKGRVTVKVVPVASELVAVMVPPWMFAISRAMLRPSP